MKDWLFLMSYFIVFVVILLFVCLLSKLNHSYNDSIVQEVLKDAEKRKNSKFVALPGLAGSGAEGDENMPAEVRKVPIAIGLPADHLDLEVDAFGEAIGVTTLEVVQDPFAPVLHRPGKDLQRFEATGLHLK